MYRPEVYIRGQRLDLFKDESIRIVSSVQKIEDISRVFNDYSKSFTVPASANNNRIFKHWYNFSITNGFDARIRHEAHIDIQSANFRKGTIRLEKAEIKNNKPVHYKLTFFGQLIELKTVIGEDYLSSLDFSQYDIEYSSLNVKQGLTAGFDSENVIFPMISTDKQWFYNSNITDITNQDKFVNIAWNGSTDDHGMAWTSFRPALKVMKVVEAIEKKYDLEFSRDFLGTEPFDKLYLWLANSDSEEALNQKTRLVDYDVFNSYQPAIGSFNNTTGSYDVTQNGASKIRNAIFLTDSNDGVAYKIQLMNGDEVLQEESGSGNLKIDFNIDGGVEPGSSIYGRIVTAAEKTITLAKFEVDELSDDQVCDAQKNNFTISGSALRLSDFTPTIKALDFLKSLIKMFNMTVIPSSQTSFDIYTLDDWYSKGAVYDISKYLDTSEISVSRSKIFREIRFAHADPQTILADQFKKVNKVTYGDLETKLKNMAGKPLDGDVFEVELDFEQMVYERLIDINDNSGLSVVYGLSLDDSLSDTIPEAHLFYGDLKSVASNQLSFIEDSGTKSNISGSVFMPRHTESDQKKYSTCFGGEIDEHTGGVINNSLYQLYYRDYITDSFSILRRKFDLSARLPLFLMNKLRLNDKLIIGADRYIINEMTVNVTNQMTEFELLNDIFGDGDIQDEQETPESEPQEPPVFTGNSFAISAQGASTTNGGCSQTPNTTKYWSGSESQPTLGNFIYLDVTLSQPFDGQMLYYKIEQDKAIRINQDGIVIDVFFCGQNNQGGGNQ